MADPNAENTQAPTVNVPSTTVPASKPIDPVQVKAATLAPQPVPTTNPASSSEAQTTALPKDDKPLPTAEVKGEPTVGDPSDLDETTPPVEVHASEIEPHLLSGMKPYMDGAADQYDLEVENGEVQNHERFKTLDYYWNKPGGPLPIAEAKTKLHEAAQILADFLNS